MEKENSNYFVIDILKLIFSFCVVALHTNLFLDEWPIIYWYSSHCIWRIAVPFFFVTSGYFFCKKVKNSSAPKKILKSTIIRLLLLLSFWLLISLPLEVNNLIIQKYTPIQVIIEIMRKIICYPWGALWYISSLIVSYLLIYPFLKKRQYKIPLLLGAILYLFAILGNSYYFVIENTTLSKIMDAYLNLFYSTRNGIFVGFFYIAIANYLTEKKEFSNKTNIALLIVGIIGLICETTLIRERHYIEDHSLFFSLLIITPALFEISKSYSSTSKCKAIRKLSVGIYVMHRPILGYLNYFFQIESKTNSIQLFLIILILSISASYFLQKVDNKYINKIIT